MTLLATCIIMAVGALIAMAIGICTTIALDRLWCRSRSLSEGGITVTTYTVIAANKFYWQRLCVVAASPPEAAELFCAYLAAPQQQADEKYEYDEQCKHVAGAFDADEVEQPDRTDYTYSFNEDDISEDDSVRATPEVRMIESGGNG